MQWNPSEFKTEHLDIQIIKSYKIWFATFLHFNMLGSHLLNTMVFDKPVKQLLVTCIFIDQPSSPSQFFGILETISVELKPIEDQC